MKRYEKVKNMDVNTLAELFVTCINPYEEVADFEYLSTVLSSIYYDKELCIKDTREWLEKEAEE